MPASAPSFRWYSIHRGQGLLTPLSSSTRIVAATKLEDKMGHALFSGRSLAQSASMQLISLTAQDAATMTKWPAGAMLTLPTLNARRKPYHGVH